MQDDRYYRNDGDYDYYTHRGNRRKSLDRYAMRPGQHGNITTHSKASQIQSILYIFYADRSMVGISLCSFCSRVSLAIQVFRVESLQYQLRPLGFTVRIPLGAIHVPLGGDL